METLYKAHTSIRRSGINRILVELRISQINGCAYCCSYHAKKISHFGFEQYVINRLPGWKHTPVFNDQQKLVLE